jgi:hypothetical protein
MSRPMDQIDNSRTKPLQMEHDGQMSSDRSQSDVRPGNRESLVACDAAACRLNTIVSKDARAAAAAGPIVH